MNPSIHAAPAPAKLNLFLHVTGRRPDGYHELESIFQLIDLHDRIHLNRRSDGLIRRLNDWPEVPPEIDLAVRAAQMLQATSGTAFGVDLALEKHIPLGGGLGGGSSDAATVLLCLNQLWNLHWPTARLTELGLRLGADVPFFLFGHSAMARGIGENLQAIDLPPSWYVVVAPPVQVATASIFSDPELTRNTEPLKIDSLTPDCWLQSTRNDLQPVVLRRFPEVALAFKALQESAHAAGFMHAPVRMSGSGACLFCPVTSEDLAQVIAGSVQQHQVGTVHVCRGLARHPLGSRQVG